MRGRCFWLPLFLLTFVALPAHGTPEQDYLQIYLGLNDAELSERNGDFKGALIGFEDDYNRLGKLREEYQGWENVLTMSRMEDCRAKILELENHVYGLPGAPFPRAMPDLSPSPRFVFANYPPHEHTEMYPWKTNITTSVFWIGDDSSATSWDPNWIHHNNGPDFQYDLSGYASSTHASTLNPFYVALPFNDLANPGLTAKWLPDGWIRPSRDGKPVSSCKDRWVEIKSRSGRYCFAQWEDVGPRATDDAAYVFGPQRPSARAGLSVSPAVAKYLGFDASAITSWRFVDDADVLPGMWMRYDEQALLFRAMLGAGKK